MSKEKNVVDYYVLCNKLKNVIRRGWTVWNVDKDRIESVAEHIFGTQMLAISMYSEYKYDIDIKKVVYMLAVHELEEIIIGDLTLFDISAKDKEKIGHEAVNKVLNGLSNKKEIYDLVIEFDERKTKEARFAFYCDKLECDIQAKLYDEENCVDLNNQDTNFSFNDEKVQKHLKAGRSFGEMWVLFGQERYNYDENFSKVSNYVLKNKISK